MFLLKKNLSNHHQKLKDKESHLIAQLLEQCFKMLSVHLQIFQNAIQIESAMIVSMSFAFSSEMPFSLSFWVNFSIQLEFGMPVIPQTYFELFIHSFSAMTWIPCIEFITTSLSRNFLMFKNLIWQLLRMQQKQTLILFTRSHFLSEVRCWKFLHDSVVQWFLFYSTGNIVEEENSSLSQNKHIFSSHPVQNPIQVAALAILANQLEKSEIISFSVLVSRLLTFLPH